jgi:hypothetical protein
MMEDLSLYIISGEVPPANSNEKKCLEDLNTRLDIILTKKDINNTRQDLIDDANPGGLT